MPYPGYSLVGGGDLTLLQRRSRHILQSQPTSLWVGFNMTLLYLFDRLLDVVSRCTFASVVASSEESEYTY